jgi:hypothetical protein
MHVIALIVDPTFKLGELRGNGLRPARLFACGGIDPITK